MRKTQIIPYKESDFKETNADRIRHMTDEQLAAWFAPHMLCRMCPKEVKIAGCNALECKRQALIWLKQEVKPSEDTEER